MRFYIIEFWYSFKKMDNNNYDKQNTIEEIKKILPKNMKKEKIKRVEYLIDKMHKNINENVPSKKKIFEIKIKNTIIKKGIKFMNSEIVAKEGILKESIKIFKEKDVIHKVCHFNEYDQKNKNNKSYPFPSKFFMGIAENIINNLKTRAEDIYKIKFIEKKDIFQETTSSFSFVCIYIDNHEIEINNIKIIVHVIQCCDKFCFIRIMPNANITNRSIYFEIEHSIEKKMELLKIA